jgi:arylsulfatase A-like enzyme
MARPAASQSIQGFPSPVAWNVLAAAAWFGLVAGLIEVATKVLCAAFGRFGHLYQMSRHFFWLVPVTNLLVFTFLGLLLALLAWVAPRIASWLSLRGFLALALLPPLLLALPEIHPAAWCILGLGISVWVSPFLEQRALGFTRLVRRSWPLLAAGVMGLAGWVVIGDWLKQSREAALPLPPRGSPNVLLIVLDTVRADRLSLYGYERKTTPALEFLATRGIRFDAARSTAPWTLPSHASLFTGRLPHELNVEWLAPLGVRFPTIAGYLGSRGYATAGFVANTLYCGYDTGLSDGFTHYVDYNLPQMDAFLMAQLTSKGLGSLFQLCDWLRAHQHWRVVDEFESFLQHFVFSGDRKDAAEVNREFFGWLSKRPQPARPFFAFLNYMDAHVAYFPSGPPGFVFGTTPADPADFRVLQDWEQLDKPPLDDRLKRLASDSYDSCIRSLDEQLKLLLLALDRQGILDHTLVVVTSDHGEGFGEHDLYVHGDSVYRPEINVPLLIVPPRSNTAHEVVKEVVSLRDIPATLVDLLHLEAGSPFPGHSLVRTRTDTEHGETAWAVSELACPNPSNPNKGRSPAEKGPLTALTDGRFSYISGPEREELYDELEDAGQDRNLASEPSMAAMLDRFRAQLRSVLDREPAHGMASARPAR